MERSHFEHYRKYNESLCFWSSPNQNKKQKKNNLYCLNRLGSRELHQIQIYGKGRYKIKSFSVQNTKQYFFYE